MAEACTIPCSARRLQGSLQGQIAASERYRRLPALGVALVAIVAGVIVLPALPAITGIILIGWGVAGAAVVLAQAWLGAAQPARVQMPAEVARLVEANAERMHVARLPGLRARAAALSLDRPNFDANATHLLLDLREATGEAWRCPCPKRRLPIPLPF